MKKESEKDRDEQGQAKVKAGSHLNCGHQASCVCACAHLWLLPGVRAQICAGQQLREDLGKNAGVKRSPDFKGDLLPPLKMLLNHHQITVKHRFLLDRKTLELHSSQHSPPEIDFPQGEVGDYPNRGLWGHQAGASQTVSHSDPEVHIIPWL